MGAATAISWADHTFNPWEGCTRISPACDHCYAADRAHRFGNDRLWAGELRRTSPANWRQPQKWNRLAKAAGRPARVFCASLADVFDNQAPQEWREDLWQLIESTPHLIWMLLTKRIGNVERMIDPIPTNVWLGITVANQPEADRDIPKLLDLDAPLRFLSCEPLLGPIDLDAVRWSVSGYRLYGCLPNPKEADDFRWAAHRAHGVRWVIAGGESGRHARPSDPGWFRSLRDQCAAAGVPFHFKQWGEYLPEGQFDSTGFQWAPGEDGRTHWWEPEPPVGQALPDGACSVRIGTSQAGRLLDRVEHLAMPEVA